MFENSGGCVSRQAQAHNARGDHVIRYFLFSFLTVSLLMTGFTPWLRAEEGEHEGNPQHLQEFFISESIYPQEKGEVQLLGGNRVWPSNRGQRQGAG